MSGSSAKPKAVVDTNLFVSSAMSPLGSPGKLVDAWDERRFRLLLSDRQRTELIDVFARPGLARRFRLPQKERDELLNRLAKAEAVPLHLRVTVAVRDPNDEHILAAALGGEADFLVTGDDDLLSLAGDPRLGALRIVTVVEFLTILTDSDREAGATPPGRAEE